MWSAPERMDGMGGGEGGDGMHLAEMDGWIDRTRNQMERNGITAAGLDEMMGSLPGGATDIPVCR